MDLPLCQDSSQQVVVLQSKSNSLFEDFVLVFLLVFHPFEYHLGYDGNRFLDKPSILMKCLFHTKVF